MAQHVDEGGQLCRSGHVLMQLLCVNKHDFYVQGKCILCVKIRFIIPLNVSFSRVALKTVTYTLRKVKGHN